MSTIPQTRSDIRYPQLHKWNFHESSQKQPLPNARFEASSDSTVYNFSAFVKSVRASVYMCFSHWGRSNLTGLWFCGGTCYVALHVEYHLLPVCAYTFEIPCITLKVPTWVLNKCSYTLITS